MTHSVVCTTSLMWFFAGSGAGNVLFGGQRAFGAAEWRCWVFALVRKGVFCGCVMQRSVRERFSLSDDAPYPQKYLCGEFWRYKNFCHYRCADEVRRRGVHYGIHGNSVADHIPNVINTEFGLKTITESFRLVERLLVLFCICLSKLTVAVSMISCTRHLSVGKLVIQFLLIIQQQHCFFWRRRFSAWEVFRWYAQPSDTAA